MSQVALSVKSLSKFYGKYRAVDNVSFDLKKGQILGLLGPNGAGKTTTIQMLLGLTTPDAGQIKYFDRDFSKYKPESLSRINFASTYNELQGKITVRQNLEIFARLYQVKNFTSKIDKLLELFEISHLANTTYWKLSSGQQTRAILAKSLINDPEILLMDEPTASLDPEIVNKMIDLIHQLQQEREIAILFTSHNMEEVSRLCDEVIFLQNGKVVAQDTPSGLTALVDQAHLTVLLEARRAVIEKYLNRSGFKYRFIKSKLIEIDLPEEKIAPILFGFKKQEIFVHSLNIRKPTLEDVFLKIARGRSDSA